MPKNFLDSDCFSQLASLLKTTLTTLLTAYTNQSCIQCDEMDIFSPLKDIWRMSRDALKVFMSIDHDPFISWAMHLSTKIYFIIKCIKVNVIQKCITSDKSQIRKKKRRRKRKKRIIETLKVKDFLSSLKIFFVSGGWENS